MMRIFTDVADAVAGFAILFVGIVSCRVLHKAIQAGDVPGFYVIAATIAFYAGFRLWFLLWKRAQ